MPQKWKPEVSQINRAEVLQKCFVKSIYRHRILRFIRRKRFGLCRIAELLLWAVISMGVMVVEIFPSVTILVGIGIERTAETQVELQRVVDLKTAAQNAAVAGAQDFPAVNEIRHG